MPLPCHIADTNGNHARQPCTSSKGTAIATDDPRTRRGLPERWLLPPAPRDEPAASRWQSLPFGQRRELARTGPDGVSELEPWEREVVAGLSRSRLRTRWRLMAAAPALGWLVLMAVWGFGRSTYPQAGGNWLLAGLALGAATWFVAAVAAAHRLRRTRAVNAAATTSAESDDGP